MHGPLGIASRTPTTPTTTAWDAIAKAFSDDLNLKIGDLLSRSLSTATCSPCRRPFMLAHDTGAHLHVCARARSRLRAGHARTKIVASDLLSSPVSRRSTLTPFFPRHQHTLRAPVDAFARDARALLHVCARTRSRLRARYTRAPVVACARSRSRMRLPYARTRCSLRAANA